MGGRGRTDLGPFYSRRNPLMRLGCEARRLLGILLSRVHVGCCWVGPRSGRCLCCSLYDRSSLTIVSPASPQIV